MEVLREDFGGMYVETGHCAMFQVSEKDLSLASDSKISLTGGENESQLHNLEKSAYTAVLRAFCAQSNALSWGKEGLITELRKELRVSDVEHRQILAVVSTDKSIKLLRGRRTDLDSQVAQEADHKKNDVIHVSPKTKKLKAGTRSALAPISGYIPSAQAQHANIAAPGLLIKNRKGNKVSGTGNSFSAGPCIYALPAPVTSGFDQIRHPVPARPPVPTPAPAPASAPAPAPVPVPRASAFINQQPISKKKRNASAIHIRRTDKIIQQVKETCSNGNSNPAVVEKAKKILVDQEKALLEAICVLDDVSDSEEPPKKGRTRGHNKLRHRNMSSLCV